MTNTPNGSKGRRQASPSDAGAAVAAAADSHASERHAAAEPAAPSGPAREQTPDRAPAAVRPVDADDGAAAIVNVEEFARIAGKSVPTIRAYIRDGMPIVSEGQHGVEYEIDARAAAAWTKDRDDAGLAARKGRQEQLAALQVELFGESIDPEVEHLTPEQRSKVAAAKYQENRLAEQQGALVRAEDLRRCADVAFNTLQRELRPLAVDVAKTYGLPRAARVAIEAKIKGALQRCAAKLEDETTYGTTTGERRSPGHTLRLIND